MSSNRGVAIRIRRFWRDDVHDIRFGLQGVSGLELSRSFDGDGGILRRCDMSDGDLPRRLDPFSGVRDAGISADGLNDAGRSDHLDFIGSLNEVCEGEAKVVVAAGKKPGGVRMAVEGTKVGEFVIRGDFGGTVPVQESFLDGVAFGVATDSAFPFVA